MVVYLHYYIYSIIRSHGRMQTVKILAATRKQAETNLHKNYKVKRFILTDMVTPGHPVSLIRGINHANY